MFRPFPVIRCSHAKTPTQNSQRGIHLLHQMFCKYPVHSQLASIRKKKLPSADNTILQLYDISHNHVGTISLSEAFKYIKPGTHLSQSTPQTYQVKPLKNVPKIPQSGLHLPQKQIQIAYKRKGRSKDIPFVTTDEPSLVRIRLDKAYDLLLQGSRVEFRLRQKTKPKVKDKTIDWALEHALHLRPDSILAAMPEGSTMLAKPCTVDPENEVLIWAIEHPPSLKRSNVVTPKAAYELGTWEKPYIATNERPTHNKPVSRQAIKPTRNLSATQAKMNFWRSR
ncbi:hypothetical protein N7G274_010031 [Stereocaulon virgatum]|uniref:Uncharacterized protein n=1 Tax=Stereocaulon virgatum TaxID=373712 RepID=A0ABR3ZV50_9LECA